MQPTPANAVPAPEPAVRITPPPAAVPPVVPAEATDPRLAADADVRSRVLGRFDAATTHGCADTMAALRSAVTDLVDQLRAKGLSLTQVVESVEALLREHGAAGWTPTLLGAEDPARAALGVRAHVLDWCVRAYHDDDWW